MSAALKDSYWNGYSTELGFNHYTSNKKYVFKLSQEDDRINLPFSHEATHIP